MRKVIQRLFVMILGVLMISTVAQAQNPVQLSLFPPIQLVKESQSVSVLRISLYGKNTHTQFFDFGIVSHNTSGESKGIQWSFVGIQDDFTGWQNGGLNYSTGHVTGLMTGAINYSGRFTGIQFGLINYTKSAKGIQLGLLNFINKGGFLPIFPIFNFSL